MNKNLLAAAIAAGLMVPGLATADVKIFGVIQAETGNVDYSDNDGFFGGDADTNLMGGNDGRNGAIFGGGPNQLGFKGTEKLGNGLTAFFKINTEFSTFDTAKSFNGRDSYVGVKGKGWSVAFGRMNTLYKTASHKYDPFVATGLQARATGAISGSHNNYANDLMEVTFKSGNFSGGVQLTWEDSTNENNTADNSDVIDAGSWNGRIKYKTKSWEVGLAYIDLDYGTGDGDADMYKIHGKWSGNGFTVAAQYENGDVSNNGIGNSARADGSGANGIFFPRGFTGNKASSIEADDYDSWMVTGSYAISGNTSIHATYANADADVLQASAPALGADVDIDYWAIGATHKFSKRTSVYGGFTSVDYDNNYSSFVDDQDLDIWAIGLRHKF